MATTRPRENTGEPETVSSSSDKPSRLTAFLRNKYTALIGGAAAGATGKAAGLDSKISNFVSLAPAPTINGLVTNFGAPMAIGHQVGKLIPENRPGIRAGVQAGSTAIAALAPSYVTVPVATGLMSYVAANKAVQWSGLNRGAYASMEGPGMWNFTKRNVISTPGKVLTGLFWSGWSPKMHDKLTWQERIGAAPIQAVRGSVRSFYTPWDKLQGFEKVPGFFVRPVVSALSTVWKKLPGTNAFESPDKFGQAVGNLAWSPVKAAGWLAKAPGRFWKYAWADPDKK